MTVPYGTNEWVVSEYDRDTFEFYVYSYGVKQWGPIERASSHKLMFSAMS